MEQAELCGSEMAPFEVDLEALTAREKVRTSADVQEIFERIYRGSMPAIVSGENTNSQIFYSSYLSTYIERDVRGLSDAVDSPYSNNLLKRLVKTPKLYFCDTGLVCHLTRWSNAEVLQSGAMNGAILENYVVSEIGKTYLNVDREPYMYYYRDKDAREIDIVLEHDGILNPVEIKKTSNPGTELTRVFALLDKASVPRGKGAVVCMKPRVGAIDGDNYVVPVWCI